MGRAVEVSAALAGALVRSVVISRGRPGRGVLADAVAAAFVGLGSAYLKLGQILASAPGVIGEEVADAFRQCLDLADPIPQDALHSAMERAAGRPITQAYREIDDVAVGRASIAVVHRAVTREGVEVAVKVRRPHIDTLVAIDLALLRGIERLASILSRSPQSELAELLDDFERTVTGELDLDAERRAMERARPRLAAAGLRRVLVPATHAHLSDRDVLVMDHVRGRPIDDVHWLSATGRDAGPLVDDVIRAWLVTSLDSGEFHGDCHAGNLLVLEDERVALLDWGNVGRLSERAKELCHSLLVGSLGVDAAWERVAAVFRSQYGDRLTNGFGISDDELPGAVRDLLGPLLTAPFGNRSVADFMDQVKLSDTAEPTATAPAPRTAEDDFEQGFFLWLKQLVFFERYARIHHRYRSIANHAAEVFDASPDVRFTEQQDSSVVGLHHAGLVTSDLDATKASLERLGFTVGTPMVPALPGGRHGLRPFGAANCHADFQDGTFLEAMTVVDSAAAVPRSARLVPLQVPERAVPHLTNMIDEVLSRLRQRLEVSDGLHVLVFEAPHIYAEGRRLSDRGIGHSGVTSATRREPGMAAEPIHVVEIDDSRRPTPEGRLALASPAPRSMTSHPNGALGLSEVVLCVDPDAEAATTIRYEELLDITAIRTSRGIEFSFDSSRLVIMTPAQVADEGLGECPANLPAFVAVTVTVIDLNQTVGFLRRNGHTPRQTSPTTLVISAGEGSVTAIVFEQCPDGPAMITSG